MVCGWPQGEGDGSRGPPRVDLVRGSRGGPDLGLRRHLPAVGVDVHLRPRLPRRAHRPGRAPRAGLLQLRRPLHRRRRRRRGRGGCCPAARTSGSSGPRASGAGSSPPTRTAPARLAWSTARASSSTAPASTAAWVARCTSPRWRPTSGRSTGSPTSAGSSRSASRRTPTTTATSRASCGSGSGATGVRAATSSTGGAPTSPDAFRGPRPVYRYLQRRAGRAGGAPVYDLLVRQLSSRPKHSPLAHPAVRR